MASKEELKQILRELRSGGDSERQPQGGALPRRSPCQAIASPSEVGGTDAQAGGVRDSATSHPPRARIVRPLVDRRSDEIYCLLRSRKERSDESEP